METGVKPMLKKDGTIKSKDSIVYESYQKLRARKKEVLAKSRKIQQDLCSGQYCINDFNTETKKED